MSIYVETLIRGPLEDLWRRTQDPALHERWDLRFSEIDYMPRDGDGPQRFRYETRIGFGLRVSGEGESSGTRDGVGGARTSSLRFWSTDPKSLIREGSGYWQYVPTADGVRFLTSYDYRTRFGSPGHIVDRLLFRPLIGWATAWSFDRLRLWIERGIDPALSLERGLVHACARLALIVIFLYQGLVPKLLYRHASELRMLSNAGLPADTGGRVLIAIGIVEVALGAALLLRWRARWPIVVILALMPVALIGVAIFSPTELVRAFNPVTFNIAVAALAGVAWLTSAHVPSAARCLRARPGEHPRVPA
ncbi:MAG: DoxX-like family protein [Gemmatimonadota bacterium]|nr:DoxX-like family protein [Gemmatimonadota bacterium]